MEAQLEIINHVNSFVFKLDTDMWPNWHFHPEYDILLILKNTGQYICGDHIGTMKPGTLILTGPNVPHATHPVEKEENDPAKPATLVVQFSEQSFGGELFKKKEFTKIRSFLAEASHGFEFSGETRRRAEEHLMGMCEMSDLQRFAHLLLLFEMLADSPAEDRQSLASPGYQADLKSENVDRVDRVTRYILEDLSRKVTLDEVADLVCMSPKSFSRFFKKSTGKNFVTYVNELKVGHACRLLTESKMSITEIAFDSGYNSLSNFNRRFLEVRGMTPREFRAGAEKLR